MLHIYLLFAVDVNCIHAKFKTLESRVQLRNKNLNKRTKQLFSVSYILIITDNSFFTRAIDLNRSAYCVSRFWPTDAV